MRSLIQIMQDAGNFDYPESVREQKINELTAYPCEEVIKVLAKIAVVDISFTVRRAATFALKQIDPAEAFSTFVKNLNHQNPSVLTNTLHALRQVGGHNPQKAIQAASRLLTHNHPKVSETAAITIQKLAGAKIHKPHPQTKTSLHVVAPAHAFN